LSSPELLLLDEPLAALDRPLQVRILQSLRKILAERPLVTLLVTHDPSQIEALDAPVLELKAGRIASP
jgi:molybdate transport system ATP-binding protein